MLSPILLQIAKTAILSKFDAKHSLDTQLILTKHPDLANKGAAFVTLKFNNDLRGCIGSITTHRILLEDIIRNAQNAAFHDPRFRALGVDELGDINLEVSVLSEPVILEYDDYADLLTKVRPNIDGLILKSEKYQGTFLPQVWEQLQTPSLFLEHLSLKAGATPSIYNEHPTIYRYEVEHIEESFDAILPL